MNTQTIKVWEVTSATLPPMIIMAWNSECARFVWRSELLYYRTALKKFSFPVPFTHEDIPPLRLDDRSSYGRLRGFMKKWNVQARPAKAWSEGNEFWFAADKPKPQAIECDPWYVLMATQDRFPLSRWMKQINAYDRSPGGDNALNDALKKAQGGYQASRNLGERSNQKLKMMQVALIRLSMELPAISNQSAFLPREGYSESEITPQVSTAMTDREFIDFHKGNIGLSNGEKIMVLVGRETNFNALNRSDERHRQAATILVSGYGFDIRELDAREVKALWEGGTSELTLEGHCIELGIKDIW